MDGLNIVFLLLSFTSAAFAYNCVVKACYSGQCIGAETTCPANATNGCMIRSISGIVSGKTYNCSSEPCVPAWTNISGNVFTTDCCFTDRCNDDSMPLNTLDDQNVDECYSVVCNYEGCLSEAISDKKARVCKRPQGGYCMTTETDGMPSTTCSPGPCTNMEFDTFKVECCTGDLCNSPTAPPTTNDPNVDECYRMTCVTEGCLSEAIREGTAGFCPRPPGGNCMSMKQMGTNSTFEVADCRDGEESSCLNMALYDFPAGENMLAQCCQGELCNDGIAKETPKSCYAVTCNYTGCIEDAMLEGVYAYCPQMGYGCKTTFAGELSVTTCASEACIEYDTEYFKVECCSGNRCNAPQGFTPPTVNTSSATTVKSSTGTSKAVSSSPDTTAKPSTRTSAAVSSSTATMVKSSTGTSKAVSSSPDTTAKPSTRTSAAESSSTTTVVKSSAGTAEAASSSTTTMVKSSTGTSEKEFTTKKDTSGAATLRYPRYFICFLAILLLSVVK